MSVVGLKNAVVATYNLATKNNSNIDDDEEITQNLLNQKRYKNKSNNNNNNNNDHHGDNLSNYGSMDEDNGEADHSSFNEANSLENGGAQDIDGIDRLIDERNNTDSYKDTQNNNSGIVTDFEEDSESSSILPFKFLNNVDPRVMSDLIIGLSDGLTVPFALTAGLSSLGDTRLVITGGLAELVSGAISMGLGGFLAARSEVDYYKSQVKRERQEFFNNPNDLETEIEDIMIDMGASIETIQSFTRDLERNPKQMIDFIIRFGRGLEEPPEGRQLTSALTIGLGYFFGGFIPLIPYFFAVTVGTGLIISVIVMIITLFLFGYFKIIVTMGNDCSLLMRISEGLQMVLVGSAAAGCAWGLVYLIDSHH
ncbi:unnamed protein product [[Candida] boidinii]|nr:hypothetical protein B5S30_g4147 [[Candida] boidinii]OWB85960.1 hypothetical protein B5S33_g4636 [[Candida] boidinii]GMF03967.1 unnamed protein product [[Candida] boidinii]GMF99834.1 unnamed protein product [[Candida] boidinii]